MVNILINVVLGYSLTYLRVLINWPTRCLPKRRKSSNGNAEGQVYWHDPHSMQSIIFSFSALSNSDSLASFESR